MSDTREQIASAVADVFCPGEYPNKTCYELAERIEKALRAAVEYIEFSDIHADSETTMLEAVAAGISALRGENDE